MQLAARIHVLRNTVARERALGCRISALFKCHRQPRYVNHCDQGDLTNKDRLFHTNSDKPEVPSAESVYDICDRSKSQ